VDYSPNYGYAIPKGILQYDFNSSYKSHKPFTPVVFITNATFEHADDKQIKQLVDHIWNKVTEINNALFNNISFWEQYNAERNGTSHLTSSDQILNKLQDSFTELQIDCDWTEKTKEKYFNFLKLLKSKMYADQKLSCTVRLHQYKYRSKTGIPPVDKAMLMCYNMDEIKNYKTKNSIFNEQVLKQYIIDEKYPIHLDIALPLFAWGVVFRNEAFVGLLNNLNQEDIKADTNLVSIGANLYRFKIEAEIGNTYIRKGDVLRLETSDNMDKAVSFLKAKVVEKDTRISFFHWDYELLKDKNEIITNCYNSFH